MNEFASLAIDEGTQDGSTTEESALEVGDLVTLTIVDVFETDNQGKLLSYCPTFDNRAIRKTNQTTEKIRKSSKQIFSILGKAKKAVKESEVTNKASEQISKMGLMQHAKNVAGNVFSKVDEAVKQQINSSPQKSGDKEVDSSAEKDSSGDAATVHRI